MSYSSFFKKYNQYSTTGQSAVSSSSVNSSGSNSTSSSSFNSSSSASTGSASYGFSKTQYDFVSSLFQQVELVSNEVKNLRDDIQGDVKKGKDDIVKIKEKLDSEIKDTRGSILSSLALFVGFFSFISVNVGIYSKAESIFDALLVLTASFIFILIFVVLSIFVIHNKRDFSDSFRSVFSWGILIASFSISILCLGFVDKHTEKVIDRLEHRMEWVGHAPNKGDIMFEYIEKTSDKTAP